MAAPGPLGWIDDPQAVAESESRMCVAGVLNICGAAGDPLTGYARRQIALGQTYSLAQTPEATLGQSQGAYFQQRGTCVDQGSSRACQDSLYAAIDTGNLFTPVCRVARGPVYALARRKWRYGFSNSNSNDGLAGAHWAEIAATVGVFPARKVGAINLELDQEVHATTWANTGVPAEIIGAAVKVRAHRPRTTEQMADCLFAGYFGAQCSGSYFDGQNGGGFAKRLSLGGGGGHCEEVCGAYVDDRGEIQFVRQQSWGDKAPAPQPWWIQPSDAEKIQLRPGSYPVHTDDMAYLLERGEVWCFQMTMGFGGGI